MYNRYKCEYCGANLDPEKQCECEQQNRLDRKVRKRNKENYREYAEEKDNVNIV